MDNTKAIRDHVVAVLKGGQAYNTFEEIVGAFTPDSIGIVPKGIEHSAWQVVEHLRISLRDILEFSRNDDGSYKEMNWPDDYWPKSPTPPTPTAWGESIAAYQADLKTLEDIVNDPAADLFKPFPWGDGQTFLREALLAADHTAYHCGQLILIGEFLGKE